MGIPVIEAAPNSLPDTSSCELDSLKKPHCKRSSRLKSPHNYKETDYRSRAKMTLGCHYW